MYRSPAQLWPGVGVRPAGVEPAGVLTALAMIVVDYLRRAPDRRRLQDTRQRSTAMSKKP